MKSVLYFCLFGFIVACACGCGDSKDDDEETCVEGTFGCPCINGWTCDIGLTCTNDMCVPATGDSDTGQGQDSDTGQGQDSDTGQGQDSDTGTTDLDGGTGDAGGDGGTGDEEACHAAVKNWDADFAAKEEEFLSLVNQKRSQGATCGGVPYNPPGLLAMDASLRCANRFFAYDVYNRNYNPSSEPDKLALCELGATSSERAKSAGFAGVPIGGGYTKQPTSSHATVSAVFDLLMADENRCKQLMDGAATYIGIGYGLYPPQSASQYHYLSYSIGRD